MRGLFSSFGPNVLAALETDIPRRTSGYTPNFKALEEEAVGVFLQKYKQLFG